MKIFKQIIIAAESFCAFGILWCIINIFLLTPGTEPDDILSAVDLELPVCNIEDTYDNLDRGASRFDNFTYHVTFSPQETTALIKKMEEMGWQREDDLYIKSVDVDEDLTYSAFINPRLGTATLDVSIDEFYSIKYVFYTILFILTASFIAGLWGIVILVSKIRTKKE